MKQSIEKNAIIPEQHAGLRIDQSLSELFPEFSRSKLTQWLRDGQITVDGQTWKAKDKVRGGESVLIQAQLVDVTSWSGQEMPLAIIHEDDALLVINKPPGLVSHPAAGNPHSTLVNALLHHCPSLSQLPRAGLIHRLDKDTSGLLVIAKTLQSHHYLTDAMQQRDIKREYLALVQGTLVAGGTVEAPMGRHPKQRIKMAVVSYGKPAVTHYRIQQKFRAHTLLQVQLETGRTHQIRVHMAHIHHPIVGDPVYGTRPKPLKAASEACNQTLQSFTRQALHAQRLSLQHPTDQQIMSWQAPIPEDFSRLIELLQQDLENNHGT